MKRPRARGVRATLWTTLAATACAPVPPTPDREAMSPQPRRLAEDTLPGMVPAGFGSLRQDDISVEIVDGSLHVKVTPLAEEVVRLAAPDTYDRLRALAWSRRTEAARATDGPGAELFLVSFFSREANVEYRPEDIQLGHRGRTQRPTAILALTTGWGRQLLQPQQTQSAIFAFEPPFDYSLPLTIRYGLRQSDEWNHRVVPRLEEERNRVLSRSGGGTIRQR